MKRKKDIIKSAIISGVIGSLLLFLIYLGILTWANSFEHAISQFKEYSILMSALIIGFGFQIYLFVYTKEYAKYFETKCSMGGTVAATGGVSTGSMVACCTHHLVDVLPILGFSAFAMFLAKYQVLFLELGIFSNLFGIAFMVGNIKKHHLYDVGRNDLVSKIMKLNYKKIKYGIGIIGILVIISNFIIIY